MDLRRNHFVSKVLFMRQWRHNCVSLSPLQFRAMKMFRLYNVHITFSFANKMQVKSVRLSLINDWVGHITTKQQHWQTQTICWKRSIFADSIFNIFPSILHFPGKFCLRKSCPLFDFVSAKYLLRSFTHQRLPILQNFI